MLLIFFTLTFVCQNVALVNLNGDNWWFAMKSKNDKIEMGLFIVRYVSTLFTFVLALKAPGISDTTNINSNDDEAHLVNDINENAVRQFFFDCSNSMIIIY